LIKFIFRLDSSLPVIGAVTAIAIRQVGVNLTTFKAICQDESYLRRIFANGIMLSLNCKLLLEGASDGMPTALIAAFTIESKH
jgi:hypothetical protein